MSFSIIVRDAYQPDGGQVCSVANLVPAGPRSQDDVDSRLSIFGFSNTSCALSAPCSVVESAPLMRAAGGPPNVDHVGQAPKR